MRDYERNDPLIHLSEDRVVWNASDLSNGDQCLFKSTYPNPFHNVSENRRGQSYSVKKWIELRRSLLESIWMVMKMYFQSKEISQNIAKIGS